MTNIPAFKDQLPVKCLFANCYSKYLRLFTRQFLEEKHQGSAIHYTIVEQYWLAFIFVMGIKKKLYFGETLQEIEDTFNITTIKYNLQCNGINIYDLYDIFEIEY